MVVSIHETGEKTFVRIDPEFDAIDTDVVFARDALANHSTEDPFRRIEQALRTSSAGSGGLLFLPWIAGIGSPSVNDPVRGAFGASCCTTVVAAALDRDLVSGRRREASATLLPRGQILLVDDGKDHIVRVDHLRQMNPRDLGKELASVRLGQAVVSVTCGYRKKSRPTGGLRAFGPYNQATGATYSSNRWVSRR